jgi:hypothetical protein
MSQCLGQKITVGKFVTYYLFNLLQSFFVHLIWPFYLTKLCEQVTKTAALGDLGNRLVRDYNTKNKIVCQGR